MNLARDTTVSLDQLSCSEMDECCTQIEQCRVKYKWTIQQFSLHLQRYKEDDDIKFNLKSSTFTSELRGQKIEWIFQLYIDESDEELMKNWISFRFNFSSQKSLIIDSYKIHLVKNTGKKHLVFRNPKVYKFSGNSDYLFYNKFFPRDKLIQDANTLLPKDTLTIIFEAVIGSDPFVVIGPKPIELPECKVLEDYVDLFSSRESSDVTFTVGEEKIKAHKAILIARSTVFAAMFKHDMMENKENCVNITDMKPEVFTELLKFIYTNQVAKIDELAEELLQAADKYQIKTLKRICEHELFQLLNIENAARILVHADNHNCPELKTHTIKFINEHRLDVIDTPGFEIMMKTHPQLLAALYRLCC